MRDVGYFKNIMQQTNFELIILWSKFYSVTIVVIIYNFSLNVSTQDLTVMKCSPKWGIFLLLFMNHYCCRLI